MPDFRNMGPVDIGCHLAFFPRFVVNKSIGDFELQQPKNNGQPRPIVESGFSAHIYASGGELQDRILELESSGKENRGRELPKNKSNLKGGTQMRNRPTQPTENRDSALSAKSAIALARIFDSLSDSVLSRRMPNLPAYSRKAISTS